MKSSSNGPMLPSLKWLCFFAIAGSHVYMYGCDCLETKMTNTHFCGESLAAPQHLLVEGLEADYAVLSEHMPRFSFQHPPLPPGVRNLVQARYRITVTMLQGQGVWTNVWDSAPVDSQLHVGIEYAGEKLLPFRHYRWTAQWAAANTSALGCSSLLSPKAFSNFETGPMSDDDWHNASWLFGFPQARFEFRIPGTGAIDWARLYIASPGCTRPTVNGRVPKPDLRGM